MTTAQSKAEACDYGDCDEQVGQFFFDRETGKLGFQRCDRHGWNHVTIGSNWELRRDRHFGLCGICKKLRRIPPQDNLKEQDVPCETCGIIMHVPSRKRVWEAGQRGRRRVFRELGIMEPAPLADVEWTERGMVCRIRGPKDT